MTTPRLAPSPGAWQALAEAPLAYIDPSWLPAEMPPEALRMTARHALEIANRAIVQAHAIPACPDTLRGTIGSRLSQISRADLGRLVSGVALALDVSSDEASSSARADDPRERAIADRLARHCPPPAPRLIASRDPGERQRILRERATRLCCAALVDGPPALRLRWRLRFAQKVVQACDDEEFLLDPQSRQADWPASLEPALFDAGQPALEFEWL